MANGSWPLTIVSDMLKQMPAVRQPQRKFLAGLFATILALRGRVTGRNLSRYCEYAERTIARQFRAACDWPDFPQRGMTAALEPPSELIAAQAASFIPQSGKPTFGLGHCFNGCASRADRGLEISTLAVVEVTRRCAFTLAVAQTPPGADKAASNQAAAETRSDFSKQQLREQRYRLPERVTSPCVDGYFAQQKDIDAVVALNLHPITKLRCAANCRFRYPGPPPPRRGPRRKYDGQVNFHDLHRCDSLGPLKEADHVQLYTALVGHVSLKRKVRGGGLGTRNNPHTPRSSVLASTALDLDGHKLVELYVARCQIEFLVRDRNQFTGRADCQARAAAVLDCHFTAALATLNLVRAEELLAPAAPLPQVFSMASWNQRQFHERLLDLFIARLALDPTWVKNQSSYDELRSYGAIAA
jgi:hypothetical protein